MEIFDWQDQDVFLISGMPNIPLRFVTCTLRAYHICKSICHIYFLQIFPSETTKQQETMPRYISHAEGVTKLTPARL